MSSLSFLKSDNCDTFTALGMVLFGICWYTIKFTTVTVHMILFGICYRSHTVTSCFNYKAVECFSNKTYQRSREWNTLNGTTLNKVKRFIKCSMNKHLAFSTYIHVEQSDCQNNKTNDMRMDRHYSRIAGFKST